MPATLYKFGGLEIARDEDDEYYLIKNGQVEDHSQEWRLIVTSFFSIAEMRVLNVIGRYEQEKREADKHKGGERGMREPTKQELEIALNAMRHACDAIKIVAGGYEELNDNQELYDMFYGTNRHCVALQNMIEEVKEK